MGGAEAACGQTHMDFPAHSPQISSANSPTRMRIQTYSCVQVSAYVTHGVFPKESWKRFVHSEGAGLKEGSFEFDHFWITDSIPRNAEILRGKEPFEILSIAPLVDFVARG